MSECVHVSVCKDRKNGTGVGGEEGGREKVTGANTEGSTQRLQCSFPPRVTDRKVRALGFRCRVGQSRHADPPAVPEDATLMASAGQTTCPWPLPRPLRAGQRPPGRLTNTLESGHGRMGRECV